MFGNTDPILGHQTELGERIANSDLRAYLRWEYYPADRYAVVLSAGRGGAIVGGRRKPRPPRATWVGKLRAWAKALRGQPPAPHRESVAQE